MRNKRGWLRIFEAVIGILIVAGVLLVIYSGRIDEGDYSNYVYEMQKRVLNDIAMNESLRSDSLNYNGDWAPTSVRNFVEVSIPSNFGFNVSVCDIDAASCSVGYDTSSDVYVEERVISSNLYTYQPKKIRLFVWGK
jgi:hypothetical protein